MAGRTRFCPPMGAYQEFEKALEGTSKQTREALTLRKHDLAFVQVEQPRDTRVGFPERRAEAARVNAGIAKRAWLKHLLLGVLRGVNGMLGPMARLEEVLGSQMAKESREATTFTRNTRLLQTAAENKVGIGDGDLDRRRSRRGEQHALRHRARRPCS